MAANDALPGPDKGKDTQHTPWVEVVYASGPHQATCVRVLFSALTALADGADAADAPTVQMAIAASGLLERFPEIGHEALDVGIWGRVATRDAPIRDRDRIEIYRPLKVDPKEARRLRSQQQGPIRSRHRPRYKAEEANKGNKAD